MVWNPCFSKNLVICQCYFVNINVLLTYFLYDLPTITTGISSVSHGKIILCTQSQNKKYFGTSDGDTRTIQSTLTPVVTYDAIWSLDVSETVAVCDLQVIISCRRLAWRQKDKLCTAKIIMPPPQANFLNHTLGSGLVRTVQTSEYLEHQQCCAAQ